MPGKIFISCGQRPPTERKIAIAIRDLLEQEFSLTPYLAFRIQSLDDIMTITKELRSSDYYLFIDFCRDPKKPEDLPISLFTHQELALAHHLGFQNIIALQQEGAPLEGFLRYLLSNPETFSSEKELLEKTRRLVKERGWSRSYSRNLVVEQIGFTGPLEYRDHTGTYLENVWQVRVRNHRPDVAAVGSVCLLADIQLADGAKISCPDRSYLKWAGQAGYERTILPNDYGDIDLFSIHGEAPGIFLHSLRDTPREPVLTNDGDYELFFKLYSQGFPMVEFSVKLSLRWTPPTQVQFQWQNNSTAALEI
jgi:hypothetical protein